MKVQAKAQVSHFAEIQPKIRGTCFKGKLLKSKNTWKKTVENLIAIGRSLGAIKEVLPHNVFIAHIKQSLGLGEMQASRLIALYRKFGSAKSTKF